jgi:hypothetical protein
MNLPYCALQVYEADRERFMLGLFVPEAQRPSLFALYALNVELMRVRSNVSEEMIGHIRYAWWYEKLEALYEGQQLPGHPVLEELSPLIAAGYLPKPQLLALAETYRAHFPEAPHDALARLDALSLTLLRHICPQAEEAWAKANNIIRRHYERYGIGRRGWLAGRLLLAGMITKKKALAQ